MDSLTTSNGLDVSPLDERRYECLTLPNALQVLLVSDPKTEKASAAMDVHVGHQSDPEELPGLAHFLEHMLFLGTAKYPDENSYKRFLSAHSGRSNASTSQMHTNFYFDVLSEHLHEALDRFAQFFIAPLFTPEATGREMNAVNSENSKNLQNDHRRLYQLQKALSNPAHPFHKFGTGNIDTLGNLPKQQGIDVRAELLKFHETYYSASIMKLVIYGKEDLATLRSWAQQLFAEIKNSGRDFPTFGDVQPFDESRLARVVHVAPVKDLRVIDMSWPLPSLHWEFLTKPTKILSHLLGHEGPGSVLSYLKSRKWANGLSAGLFRDNEDWGLFCVKVDATDAGIAQVDDVVEAVYQYIHMLQREAPFEPWIFRETQDLALQDFRFKSKESPIQLSSYLAGVMHRYPTKYIVSGGYVLYEYDAAKVQEILDLLTPQRMRLTVVSKTFEGKTTCVEKWYETPYSEAAIDSELLYRWLSPPANPALQLPHRNEFICSDFRIVTPPHASSSSAKDLEDAPLLLRQDESCRLWFKPDTQFRKPKLTLSFLLYSPALSTTPYHAVLTSLFVRYLKDELTEVSYDAELAGMDYEIAFSSRAVELHVAGFSHKLPTLLFKVLQQMLVMTKPEYELQDAVFERVKDRTKRLYQNFFLEEPYQHAVYACSQLLEASRWSVDDKITAIEHLTLQDLQTHAQTIFQQVFVESFFYGNMQQSDASPLMRRVLQQFGIGQAADGDTADVVTRSMPLFPSQVKKPRIVQLADAKEYRFQRREWNAANRNSAICTLFQLDCEREGAGMILRARLELFAHIFKEPCFNQLRTQEQLGYLVFSGIMRSEGVEYFRILVQSDVASPQLLDQRIESFVASFRSLLAEMPIATWNKQVNAVVKALREKPKRESEESMRAWREIANETFVFDRRQRVADIVAALQRSDLVAFFDSFIAVDGDRRSKLSVCLYGAKHVLPELSVDKLSSGSNSAAAAASTGLTASMLLHQQLGGGGVSAANATPSRHEVELISDVAAFKQKMPLFPERSHARLSTAIDASAKL